MVVGRETACIPVEGDTLANIIFSPEYEILPAALVEQRVRAGLSQRELAKKMGRSNAHISRIERQQARIEIVEFCNYVQACGADPVRIFSDILHRLGR